jgi:GxxExxY protein
VKLQFDQVTHEIIGAAYQVFKALGFGFLESVYKKAMVIELSKRGLKTEVEKQLTVYYEDRVVGEFFIDLFIEDEVIVELKSVRSIAKEHEVQLVNYLNGVKKEVGLLINFGSSGVQVKRKYRNPAREDNHKKLLPWDA